VLGQAVDTPGILRRPLAAGPAVVALELLLELSF
jgi:hypothetical protein